MAGKSAKKVDTVQTMEVEIFGSIYRVRGDKDQQYLRELAQTVDHKMREIAKQAQSADAAKVAILAALNLADELFEQRRLQEGERVQIQEKAAELAGELTSALGA